MRGCLGKPAARARLGRKQPRSRKKARNSSNTTPPPLSPASGEGPKRTGDAMTPQNCSSPARVPWRRGMGRRQLGARKMPVTALRFRDRGLEEFRQWWLMGLVFFFGWGWGGRGAGGEALLAGEPTWQGWSTMLRATPLPLRGFRLPLGIPTRMGGAQLAGTGCSASLVYFIVGSLTEEQSKPSRGLGAMGLSAVAPSVSPRPAGS